MKNLILGLLLVVTTAGCNQESNEVGRYQFVKFEEGNYWINSCLDTKTGELKTIHISTGEMKIINFPKGTIVDTTFNNLKIRK